MGIGRADFWQRLDRRFAPDCDPQWRDAVWRETLRGVAEVERRGVASNLIAWIVLALGAYSLPHAELFILPLALRLAAMVAGRLYWNRLRRHLRDDAPIARELRGLALTVFLSGATWALVLIPVLTHPMLHPSRMLVGGGVLVGISLIVAMLGSVRRLALAFLTGFLLTLAIGLTHAPAFMGWPAMIAMLGLCMGFCAFAWANSIAHLETSVLLLENQRLRAELEGSLAHAEFLSYHDPLTGLKNRRALFDSEFADRDNQAERHVLTVDLDYFKRINDEHGHAMGDRVLIAAAQVLQEMAESMPGGPHQCVRLGGEEFVLLTSGIDRQAATSFAQSLRGRLARIPDRMEMEGAIAVTASIGIATIEPGERLEEALRRSDLAMYRAKDRGRDRIVSAAA
ncbi:MAG: GGDEF domain-containing protein [Sphingomonadaceae bacterium]|nr:diguanylate cyclase [Sphingomonadaceae bacterium]